MKVRTRSHQLKWRLQPRRGRNSHMDTLLRNITGSPAYEADALLKKVAERLGRKHTAVEVDIDEL